MAYSASRTQRQSGWLSVCSHGDRWQQHTAVLNQCRPVAIGKEPEVPNLDEPAGEHMQEESADKLDRIERRLFNVIAVLRIPPTKVNTAAF